MTRLFALIAAITGAYLLGAFVAWDLNPARWELYVRFFAALTAVFAISTSQTVISALKP